MEKFTKISCFEHNIDISRLKQGAAVIAQGAKKRTVDSFQLSVGDVGRGDHGAPFSGVFLEIPKRYKFFSDNKEYNIKIISGSGYFKLNFGELNFTAGDCFNCAGLGEFDIYGNTEVLIISKK